MENGNKDSPMLPEDMDILPQALDIFSDIKMNCCWSVSDVL